MITVKLVLLEHTDNKGDFMITVKEMAEGYIQQVNVKIQETTSIIQENQEYLRKLEQHKQECLIEMKQYNAEKTNTVPSELPTSTTPTIVPEQEAENPFGNLG